MSPLARAISSAIMRYQADIRSLVMALPQESVEYVSIHGCYTHSYDLKEMKGEDSWNIKFCIYIFSIKETLTCALSKFFETDIIIFI